MPKLVVTVKRLNKRKVLPAFLPDPKNIAGEVYINDTFDAQEVPVVPNAALGKWYVDADGYFYWGGGVEEATTFRSTEADVITPPAGFTIENINYQNYVPYLKEDWLKNNGKGTTVIIIDTGVSISDSVFNTGLISELDITDGISPDKDHGTFIAGLVCAKNKMICGIANDAKLLSIRFKNEFTPLDKIFDNLVMALEEVIKFKQNNPGQAVCVNLSQGFSKVQQDKYPKKIIAITERIKELTALEILVFCAAGNNRELFNGNLLFPATMTETIAVGCISEEFRNMPFSKTVDFVTPVSKYKSFNTSHQIISNSGSSFSVAFITAIYLLISSAMIVKDKEQFISMLLLYSKTSQDFKFDHSAYEYFINK